jgi:L-fuconolactonase
VRLYPTQQSPGTDPLAIWRKASELDLPVSCLGAVDEFATDEFESLVSELPGLTIIIEHLAGIKPPTKPPYATFEKALGLSSFPNTYIKVGGLGEISERPAVLKPEFRFDATPPLIEMALEAFGPQRTMWGSDYPPVSGREGYRNALRGVADHPALKADDIREWVMGKTALGLFKFE